MINQYKEILYPILLGTLLGAIGVFLMGYVAAIYIPEDFILWFGNNTVASIIISVVSQFAAFGILAILAGIILGRLSKKWFLNSIVCYIAFICYVSVGAAVVYGGGISSPFTSLSLHQLPAVLLLPTCLLLSTYLSAKKL